MLTVEDVKKRAVAGVLALSGRTFLMQTVAFVANIFLTIFLLPAEFGTFAIVSALLGFLNYFSNVGLAAALIQKKDHPTRRELTTTFTIQQVLVVILVAATFIATPYLRELQQLSQAGVYLLWAMAASLLFPSLKTIPSVLLERRLDFKKLIIPEILETIVFSSVVVTMAWQGYGVTSYTVGVLARGVVGLIAMYVLEPWKPGISFDLKSLRGLLNFGIPYQANSFLALIKDEGLVIFLGGVIGPIGVGFYKWAKTWGEAALRFFMDQVIRVTFPAYARLQDDKENLKATVSRSIFFVCLLTFPSVLGLILLAPTLTDIVPRYSQWKPALLALALFGVHTSIAAVTTPLTNLLNAIGKIKITFRLMAMWTALTWLFIPYLSKTYGLNGAVSGIVLVDLSSFVAIWIAYRAVQFDIFYSVGKPLIASVVMGVVLKGVIGFVPAGFPGVSIIIALGVLVYSLAIFLLVGPTLRQDSRKVFNALLRR